MQDGHLQSTKSKNLSTYILYPIKIAFKIKAKYLFRYRKDNGIHHQKGQKSKEWVYENSKKPGNIINIKVRVNVKSIKWDKSLLFLLFVCKFIVS